VRVVIARLRCGGRIAKAALAATLLLGAGPARGAALLSKQIDPELETQGYYTDQRMEEIRRQDLALKRKTAVERSQAREETLKTQRAEREQQNLAKAEAILEKSRERAMAGQTGQSGSSAAAGAIGLVLLLGALSFFYHRFVFKKKRAL